LAKNLKGRGLRKDLVKTCLHKAKSEGGIALFIKVAPLSAAFPLIPDFYPLLIYSHSPLLIICNNADNPNAPPGCGSSISGVVPNS